MRWGAAASPGRQTARLPRPPWPKEADTPQEPQRPPQSTEGRPRHAKPHEKLLPLKLKDAGSCQNHRPRSWRDTSWPSCSSCLGSEGTHWLGRVLRASACPGTSCSARSRRRSREWPQPPNRDRAKPEPVFSPGAERGLAAGPAPDILPGNTNRELSQRAGTRAGFGKESRRGARSRAQTRAARRRTYAPQRRRAGRRPPRSESSGGGALPVPRPPAARGESKEKKAERRPTAACFPPRYRSNVTRRRRSPPLRRPRRLLGPGEGRRGPGGEGEEAGPATEAT